jgi:hypothetical protein
VINPIHLHSKGGRVLIRTALIFIVLFFISCSKDNHTGITMPPPSGDLCGWRAPTGACGDSIFAQDLAGVCRTGCLSYTPGALELELP